MKGTRMSQSEKNVKKPRCDQRFEREAKALQKNLEKRKQQQKRREQLKQEKHNG